MPSLTALSNYLPSAQTVLNVFDKCERFLVPITLHSMLGLVAVTGLGDSFKMCGLANLFSAELNKQIAAQCVLPKTFTQKFFNKDPDQISLFKMTYLKIPFLFFLPFKGTTERAHALGQFFFNTGSKILSFSNLLQKITGVVMVALVASMFVKALASWRLGKEYDTKTWDKLLSDPSPALLVNCGTALSLLNSTIQFRFAKSPYIGNTFFLDPLTLKG